MKDLLIALKKIIIEAGEIALLGARKGLIINYKNDNSPVTNADSEISDFIYDKLTALTPGVLVVCEEQPKVVNLTTNDFWLVDPIDGTRSYIKGEETYTVNIALIRNLQPVLGLIYQPATYKLYYTDSNGKLKIEQNGKEILACPTTGSYKAVVGHHHFDKATKTFLGDNLIDHVSSIPSSIKLCLIAEGVMDVYPRFGQTMEWDIAAGHALIRAMGGDIIDAKGETMSYGKPNFENPDFFACSKRWLER